MERSWKWKNDYDEERAKGILRIFKLLEKSGAIPNVQSDYGTVLSNASFNGNLLLVKYLLDEKGLDINSPDNLGRTALWYSSSKKSNVKIVEYLLSKGADKNIKFNGKTPLENAKENKCGEIVKILSK